MGTRKNSKLSASDVRAIKGMLERCGICGQHPRLSPIAAEFGVSTTAIWGLRKGTLHQKAAAEADQDLVGELESARATLLKYGIAWRNEEELRFAAATLEAARREGILPASPL